MASSCMKAGDYSGKPTASTSTPCIRFPMRDPRRARLQGFTTLVILAPSPSEGGRHMSLSHILQLL
jgi:hypothetical protein